MAELVSNQQIAQMLAGYDPSQVAPAAPAPTSPQAFFNLPPPPPTTRFFGRTGSSRTSPLAEQERYRNMVMEQEAERQAAELVNRLTEIDPADPEAPRQRLNLLTTLPLSQRSETGKTVLGAWDKEADRFHKDLASDKSGDLLASLAEAGATDTELDLVRDPSGRINSIKARRMLGELKRLQAANKKVEKTREEILGSEIRDLEDRIKFNEERLLGDEQATKLLGQQKERLLQLQAERFGIPLGSEAADAAGPITPKGNAFRLSN